MQDDVERARGFGLFLEPINSDGDTCAVTVSLRFDLLGSSGG